MKQNVILIWLDSNIDENAIVYLQKVINTIKIYKNLDDCIRFIEETQNEQIYLLVSGSFGKIIIPNVHHLSQIDSIFIFCINKQYHEQWTQNWSKIQGIYTDIKLICNDLKQLIKDFEQNTIGFSLIEANIDLSQVNLNKLDPMFMYTQILKEIILEIQFERKHLFEFTSFCRNLFENNNEINKFEEDYLKQTPIWWYTFESFLYSMVNRALRLVDIDIIIKIAFFINDLHRQIEEFNRENIQNIFTVYRGQGMFKQEFEQISKNKGGLISFNSFLSTSTNKQISMGFVRRALRDKTMIGVLFKMKIDPQQSTTSFAFLDQLSAYQNQENEVLFSMHTVFRIRDIQQIQQENLSLFQIELELTNDNDQQLQILTKFIREETFPNADQWYRMSLVLLKLGKPKQAEDIYRILLEQEKDNQIHTAAIYCQIGRCKEQQDQYQQAILFFNKSIQIYEKHFPNHSELAKFYNNIGLVYDTIGQYDHALSYYEKSLKILQQSNQPNDLSLASSYNSIGLAYSNMGQYDKALSFYEKDLFIKQKLLPFNHPNLSISYNNIGLVYDKIGQYDKALLFYEKSLTIKQQSLPPYHSDLARAYNNIGLVYNKIGDYNKALSFCEKSLTIKQQSLSPNHPNLGIAYNNIGFIYENLNDYVKAYSSYEKAVKIGEESLPLNHPTLENRRESYERIKNKIICDFVIDDKDKV